MAKSDALMPAALFVLAALCHLAPEYLAPALGWSIKALEYTAYGIEATALWWAAALLLGTQAGYAATTRAWLWSSQAICAYGMYESVQRPMCRLLLPMDRPPPDHAQGLCAAAGIPTYYATPFVLLAITFAFAGTVSNLKD